MSRLEAGADSRLVKYMYRWAPITVTLNSAIAFGQALARNDIASSCIKDSFDFSFVQRERRHPSLFTVVAVTHAGRNDFHTRIHAHAHSDFMHMQAIAKNEVTYRCSHSLEENNKNKISNINEEVRAVHPSDARLLQ